MSLHTIEDILFIINFLVSTLEELFQIEVPRTLVDRFDRLLKSIHEFQVFKLDQGLSLPGIGDFKPPENLVNFLDVTIFSTLNTMAVMLTVTVIFTIVMLNSIMVIYVERKLLARMHDRRGPSHVGYAGLLQNIADGIKLFGKEHVTPTKADKFGYNLAPLVLTVSGFVAIATIPISTTFWAANLNTGVIFVLALLSLTPFAIFIAGWSSNNKYALLGGLRATAQLVAYEIPIIFSIIGVVILAGSFNLIEIVNAQNNVWFVLFQPIGFVLLLIASLATIERVPFDLPEAEAELVEGWTTEYGGIKFGLLQLAEYVRVHAAAALITLLFLGGWHGPFLPPEVWFFIKFYAVFALMIWIRAALPRVRIDQLLRIGWGKLLPLSMVNIAIAAGVVSVL